MIIRIFSGTKWRGSGGVTNIGPVITIFGGADLDLRQATFPVGETTLKTFSLFGGTDIMLPPEVAVVAGGFSLFGGQDIFDNERGGIIAAGEIYRDGHYESAERRLKLQAVSIFGGLKARR